MSRHLTRVSEAQANAEALARRSAPYGEANRRTIDAAFGGVAIRSRGSLRDLVRPLLHEYAAEVPGKTTDGPDQLDAGGAPRFSAEFAAWLEASPTATDPGDPEFRTSPDTRDRIASGELAPDAIDGFYRWPIRAALYGMIHSVNPKISRLGRIVAAIIAGDDAMSAAVAQGAHPDDAEHTARRALVTFAQRKGAMKLRIPKQEVAA